MQRWRVRLSSLSRASAETFASSSAASLAAPPSSTCGAERLRRSGAEMRACAA